MTPTRWRLQTPRQPLRLLDKRFHLLNGVRWIGCGERDRAT